VVLGAHRAAHEHHERCREARGEQVLSVDHRSVSWHPRGCRL
jgi:hypothetical protein